MKRLLILIRSLLSFRKEKAGTAATEFALVLPVLLLAYFGAVSGYEGYRARKNVTKASMTVVDLITRSQVMNETLRDGMYEVADALIGNSADGTTIVTMTSVSNPVSESDDDARIIDWTYSNDSSTLLDAAALADMELPEIVKGESIIISRVYIEHTPRFDLGIFDKQRMSQVTYRRPRFNLRIPTEIS